MKPNADMITKILQNFRVNGKFDQDRLIIGRGVDEQLQLMITDTIGIRYVPNGGANPSIEYTNDGSTWHPFGGAGSAGIAYEPIEFTGSDIQDDGTIHIQHNFNDKNVLCLGYSIQPKEITYLDNELVLDYSDQNNTNLSGAVWFVGSQQGMLTEPPAKPEWVLSGCLDENVNGAYLPIKESDWPKYIPQETIEKYTIFQVWVNTNDKYILVTYNPSSINAIGVVPSGEWSDMPTYRRYFPNSQIPTDLSGVILQGSGDDTITITKYTGDNA